MTKKVVMVLIAAALLPLSLFGCGGGGTSASSASSSQSSALDASSYPSEPLYLYMNTPAKYEDMPKITPEELKAKMDSGESLIVVDVNPESMYSKGHIPGAVHKPWSFKGFTEDPGLPKSILLVFYCVCANEEDSGLMGLSAVKQYGYRNIVLLQGGTPAWEAAGYPLEASK